jgi:glycosyltransferase involved in cell wall biosynthesis
MSTGPLVTIGLPVYNSERFIRQSLDSLLAQTYTDFVLVISDNASTDATAEICQQYAAKDSRIRYSRNPQNIGNPGNFNRVFRLATTPYLKWSTADDYWAPTFLERAVEVMERDPSIALCYPAANLVDADGQNAQPFHDALQLMQDDPSERFLALIRTIKLAHQHLGLIRMSCLRQTHLLRSFVASDVVLLAELTLYGKFFELPERLFYRRFHKTSGSWQRGSADHQAKYYHGAKTQAPLTAWRRHLGLFAAVHSAPLPLRASWRIYRHLLRRMFWHRDELLADLSAYARSRVAS